MDDKLSIQIFGRLSKLALPIRELAKEKVAFHWGPEHQTAFNLVKKDS